MCFVGCQGNGGIYNPLFFHEAGFNFVNTRGTRHSSDLKGDEEEQSEVRERQVLFKMLQNKSHTLQNLFILQLQIFTDFIL